MRWSTVLGVLAGILVVAGAVAAFLASLPAPVSVPAPSPVAVGGSPSIGPNASPTPVSTPLPTSSPVTPSPSPSASGSSAPGESPSSTATATPSGSPDESPQFGLRIGDVAPPLSLDALGGDGSLVDISALRGRPVWVNFMGSYCPECRDELPLMERIQAQLGEDVAILLVDVKEEEPVVQDFVTTLGVTLPVGLDRDGKAADRWRALVLPIHYWLDAEGRVRAYVIGGAGPDVLLESLRTVVPNASFTP